MKKSHLLAALAASVVSMGLLGALGVAQQPLRTAMRPAGRGVPPIALLDVSYIFKNHTRFKAMMNDMKTDVGCAEAQVKAERQAVQKLAERLGEFRKGTPDYKALAEEITKRQANISVKIRLQKDEFLQQEAKIYHNVYQEILQEVDYYAAANGITLVLRFNGEPADVTVPETIIRDINKQVIWYTKDRDVTPMILDRLNQRGFRPAPASPGGTTPVGTRPGHGVPYK